MATKKQDQKAKTSRKAMAALWGIFTLHFCRGSEKYFTSQINKRESEKCFHSYSPYVQQLEQFIMSSNGLFYVYIPLPNMLRKLDLSRMQSVWQASSGTLLSHCIMWWLKNLKVNCLFLVQEDFSSQNASSAGWPS